MNSVQLLDSLFAGELCQEGFANKPPTIKFEQLFDVSTLLDAAIGYWDKCYRWMKFSGSETIKVWSVKVYYGTQLVDVVGGMGESRGFVAVRAISKSMSIYTLIVPDGQQKQLATEIATKIDQNPEASDAIAVEYGLKLYTLR